MDRRFGRVKINFLIFEGKGEKFIPLDGGIFLAKANNLLIKYIG